MLEVKNVSKVYGRGESAFSALSAIQSKFLPGETVAIVGKSGSGKSTLLHLLTGLDTPSTGHVTYDGQDIAQLDTDTWRGEHIGIIFQQFFLQPANSVVENVALPLKIRGMKRRQRELAAREALEAVGLQDKFTSRANDLSGGQKQRVAIARAIVTKPTILVADEPTGNLDSENGRIVEDLLFALNKKTKTTLIIVTHDEDLAKRCQRIIRLKDGRVVSGSERSPGKKRAA